MSYRVLARRYRPLTFRDIVGQKHVVKTLLNAIKSGRIAHAYLFSGARGVGKTSAARIYAKTLNCPNSIEHEPCCKCDVCSSISEGEDIDVIEMDGASNRGIDDIRSLRDNVSFRPARSPYKVYIIDEVHMLTREAFNALLKTLEEPPEYVKFVFCTTEPDRIPSTILSRCQRFDFHRLTIEEIKEQLAYITAEEKFSISDEALSAVARYARGGLRDSISVLEQLFSFSDEKISVEDVQLVLGAVSPEKIRELVFSCAGARTEAALDLLNSILDSGRDSLEVLEQIVGFLRDCLVAVECPQSTTLASGWLGSDDFGRAEFKMLSSSSLMLMINYLYWARPYLKEDSSGRIPLEIAIIKMSHVGEIFEIPEIIRALGNTGKAVLKAEASQQLAEVRYPPQGFEPRQVQSMKTAEVKPTPNVQEKQPVKPQVVPPKQQPEAEERVEAIVYEEKKPEKSWQKKEVRGTDLKPEPQKNTKPQESEEGLSLAALKELWYSFLRSRTLLPLEQGTLNRVVFIEKDSSFAAIPPIGADADSFLATFSAFCSEVEPKGYKLEAAKESSISSLPDLDDVRKHPVIAEALELFPGSMISTVDKLDNVEE